MKRLILLAIVLISLCLSLSLIARAEDGVNRGDIRDYIEEKILPVVIGVITSTIAFLGTLKGVLSSLKELKRAKNDYEIVTEKNREEVKREVQYIQDAYNAIKESVEDVPKLLETLENQREKIESLEQIVIVATEILSLAYSANSELVRTGKANEMKRLLSKLDIKEVSSGENS